METKVIKISENVVEVDNVVYVRESKPEDWSSKWFMRIVDMGGKHAIGRVFYGKQVSHNDIMEEPGITHCLTSVRPATKSEITPVIIKMAEEMGFVIGNSFISSFDDNGRERKLHPYISGGTLTWNYNATDDTLRSNDGISTYGNFCSNPLIYKQGVWCKAIKNRPFPTNRKELQSLLIEYANSGKFVGEFVSQFSE